MGLHGNDSFQGLPPMVFEMAAVAAADTPKQLRFHSRFPIDPRHMRSNLWSIRLKTSAMASGFYLELQFETLMMQNLDNFRFGYILTPQAHRSEKRIQVKVDHFPQRLRTRQKRSVIETTTSTSDLLLPTRGRS